MLASHLITQWHPTKNYGIDIHTIKPHSNKKIWWKCENGHEWLAPVNNRTNGRGCRYCSGQRASATNNLAIKNPKLAKEWSQRNEVGPENITAFSNKKVWWVCEQGHEWQATVFSRSSSGCPYCSGNRATSNNNLSLYPNLVKELHPTKNGAINIGEICPMSGKKMWWFCKHGHEWEARVADRTRGRKCPCCVKNYSDLEIRVLTELKLLFKNVKWHDKSFGIEIDIYIPEHKIAIEVDGSYWHKNKLRGDKKKNSILSKHGVRLIRIREKPLKSISDLDITSRVYEEHLPIMLRLVNKLSSLTNMTYNYAHIANDLSYLKMRSEYIPENNITNLRYDLVREWHTERNGSLKPENFTCGSNQKVWWICQEGHEWKTDISHRTKLNGSGCPYCNGTRVTKETSLEFVHPEISKEWDYEKNSLSPAEVHQCSGKNFWWECQKGHQWKDSVERRTTRKYGCPYCSGKRICESNSLYALKGDVCEEWNYEKNGLLSPKTFAPYSNKKVWWKCKVCNHEWAASINNRTGNKRGCPNCWRKKYE